MSYLAQDTENLLIKNKIFGEGCFNYMWIQRKVVEVSLALGMLQKMSE